MANIVDEVRITNERHAETRPVGATGVIDGSLRFETEQARMPNALGVVDRMMRPDHFLNTLADEARQREDVLVGDVHSLNMRFVPSEKGKIHNHFVIAPDPRLFPKGSKIREWFESYKEMRIDSTGYRSACKQIERSQSTLNKFDNPAGRFMSEFHDLFRRGHSKGLVLRTTNHGGDESGRTVDSFAPGNLNTISNFQLCASIMHRLNEVYGDCIRGVQTVRGTAPENLSYRILFGNPIFREAKAKDGDNRKLSFLMFSFMGSEHCLAQTEVDIGFWRLICANGAMRRDLKVCHVGWRRFDSEKRFLFRIGNMVNMAGVYGDCMARRIETLEDMRLDREPYEMLEALAGQKIMDKRTIETAKMGLNEMAVDTNWDFLNLLTDSAKTHGSMLLRSKAESRALMLAMQPKAFNGVASDGVIETAKKGDFALELRKFHPSDN